jgi:hypothetical protein
MGLLVVVLDGQALNDAFLAVDDVPSEEAALPAPGARGEESEGRPQEGWLGFWAGGWVVSGMQGVGGDERNTQLCFG